MTRQRYVIPGSLKPWWKMLDELEDGLPRLDQFDLKPGDFLSNEELNALTHKTVRTKNGRKGTKFCPVYWDKKVKYSPIERSTIFWYPPRRTSTGYVKQVAGLLLKDVIRQEVQDAAYEGLSGLDWKPPQNRAETLTAIARQNHKGLVPAGEFTVGHTSSPIELTRITRKEQANLQHLKPLIRRLDEIFKITLPEHWQHQHIPKSDQARALEQLTKKGKHPDFAGILFQYRLFLTSFSTLTLLRSCPASIHKDANARPDLTNFTALTSIGKLDAKGKPLFNGGRFCFIEYGLPVPVSPGDVLLARTTREWHCNLGRVEGEKFSIVAYFQAKGSYPEIAVRPSARKRTAAHRIMDEFLARNGPYLRYDLAAKKKRELFQEFVETFIERLP